MSIREALYSITRRMWLIGKYARQLQSNNRGKGKNCQCTHFLWIFSILLLGTASPGMANQSSVRGTWFLSFDNDVIAQSDDDYTNGLQVGWASGYLESYLNGPVPSLVGKGLAKLPLVNRSGRQRFISHSLSHRIFTPSDTETEEPIPGDMPYSGLLFATLTAGAQDAHKMDAFSLHYGIAGPSARGKEVQNQFHKIIGSNDIKGWDNQIHDELLINLGYEHRRRLLAIGDRAAWGGDIIGQAGATLGNLVSMASLGIGARFGWHVPDDFGIPPQFFGEETIGARPFSPGEAESGIWGFVLLNGSYFGNAIFWDGNTFKDSMSVDYDPAIARLYVGLRGFVGKWSGGISVVTTTVPWDNPEDRNSQVYGRLGIQYTY